MGQRSSLTSGSVNSIAPSRGHGPDTSATARITSAETMALRRAQVMRFNSVVIVVPVRFFLEVAGVRRVIDDTRDCAGVLLNHAKTLVIPNVT